MQSWEDPKDPQAQVEGGRSRLKKLRMLLQLSREKLDIDEAALLPRLKALGSDFSASEPRALIGKCEDIGTARQRFRQAQEYDQAET